MNIDIRNERETALINRYTTEKHLRWDKEKNGW